MIINEMAGSGGDLMPTCSLRKIGLLVGNVPGRARAYGRHAGIR